MSRVTMTVSSFSVSTKAEARELKPGNAPLSALTKAKASEWLQLLGEEPKVSWTSEEIKSRIKEILDLLEEEEGNKLPKGMTGMKKADLQRECRERYINFTEHETRGSMMRKIREQVEVEKGGKSGSIMGFGKFADLTYEEVAENHPAYVKWACETVKEEGFATSAGLRKFVMWVNNKMEQRDKETETRSKTASGRAPTAAASNVSRRIKRMATTEKGEDDMNAETLLMEENPNPTNRVEEQILGALTKLDRRMNSLETKQTQPEKHYPGTPRDDKSWQNLSSDRGGE